MKAMIFAAGLGSRLRPITNTIPKALVKVGGETLLKRNIKKLIQSGIKEIVVNVHHFPDQIINYLKSQKFSIPIHISDEREMLLDTGGGLKKAYQFLNDGAFLIYNVDIISNINLNEVIDFHQKNNALGTLVVRNRTTKRYLLFDEKDLLCGWRNIETKKEIIAKNTNTKNQYAFSGIHVLSPVIFNYMPVDNKFSMIELYLELAKTKKIKAFVDRSSEWTDVGKMDQLNYLNKQ